MVPDLTLSLEKAFTGAEVQNFLLYLLLLLLLLLYGLSSKILEHASWKILSQETGGMRI